MPLEPDSNAAVEFLQRWRRGGPWVLTAIRPDRKSINTRTFDKGSLPALRQWLKEHNGSFNIYFHVNPATKVLSKKAEREDIAAVDWLHIDVDPRAGEDLSSERERALGLLTTNLPTGVPAPTVVIFSGGGYQGFWRLQEPIPINGDLGLAEDAKLYNLQLEILFRADNCHNIDRIMRLPGTINIPDAKKLKKGRQPELATVVEFNDTSYPISAFTKAPIVQMQGDVGFGGAAEVNVSGNIERVEDTAELDQWDVPDRVKVIMAQGRDPDNPKTGDNSRSAWLFDFVCQMVRKEVPDEKIFAIITDPAWGISESVLEHKANAEKYALRQIAKAKEHAIDPQLVWMNERYAVVQHLGGKCLVIKEIQDQALNRPRLTKQSFGDLKNSYCNRMVQIGSDKDGNPKWRPLGDWWLHHPRRRQFETMVFAPERVVPSTVYNLWKGFAVQAIPGDCSKFLDHVRRNVCAESDEVFQYVMCWMARAVQQPGTAGEVAIVLRGGRGVGKSFFAKMFGSLFGRHFMQVSNSSHLVGNFNSHLRDLVVLFADEAFYANDKKHESILKTLVTEEQMAIEAKGVDVETSPNYIHLIMASNDIHVVPAGGDERRFLVLDVATSRQQDTGYFAAISAEMESGGREALLHTLRTWDISDFRVQRVPQTAALQEQKLLSLEPESEWWYQKLLDGQLLSLQEGWPAEVRKEQLVDDYVDHARRFNINRRGSQTSLGRFLSRVCPGLASVQRLAEIQVPAGDGWMRTVRRRCYHYQIASLAECRERWDELHGSQSWPEVAGEQRELDQGAEEPF